VDSDGKAIEANDGDVARVVKHKEIIATIKEDAGCRVLFVQDSVALRFDGVIFNTEGDWWQR
jgi:hypothetical protein